MLSFSQKSFVFFFLIFSLACTKQYDDLLGISNSQLLTKPELIGSEHDIPGFKLSLTNHKKTNNLLFQIKGISSKTEIDRHVWSNQSGKAFVNAAFAKITGKEFAGSFQIKEHISRQCNDQSIDTWLPSKNGLQIRGLLRCSGDQIPYLLNIESKNNQQLILSVQFSDPRIGLSGLVFKSHSQEQFFGLGEQFSFFNFKGKRVPILVSEQGLARGKEPLSSILNIFAKGSGGYWHNSYAPIPHFISSDLRSLALENSEYSVFDFTNPEFFHVFNYSNKLNARLIIGEKPLDLIEQYSELSGRMRALPTWSVNGVILGLQGGTQKVLDSVTKIQNAGGKIAAVWIQDWQGQRETLLGRRLWWNWELDENRYPNFESLKAELGKNNIRLMAYINPFLIDAEQKGDFKRNLYKEAIAGNYLLKDINNELVYISQGSFKAYMVDFTNPSARKWYKEVIKSEMLSQGFSGWMADFGEALPLDVKAHSGISAKTLHNQYPVEWAKINREAIKEFGSEEDSLFFMRSAFTQSPAHSTLFWMGDQATTWDNFDGIKTSVTALLSSGLSGFAFNHGDVGGYFSTQLPLGISEHRSKELLMRWIELGAFQVVFRTHEGLLPDNNAQFDSDEELLLHFARFSQIYRAWGFYREQLIKTASEHAYPVVRHPFLHYPQEKAFWNLSYQQFLIGEELWFSPVLDKNHQSVEILLPKGIWQHAFTGKLYESEGSQKAIIIPAPIGTPAILYRQGSEVGERFSKNLKLMNLI